MRFRWSAALVATLLVGACGKAATPTQTPTNSQLPNAATYAITLKVGAAWLEGSITLGKPLTLDAYRTATGQGCDMRPKNSSDIVVPYTLQLKGEFSGSDKVSLDVGVAVEISKLKPTSSAYVMLDGFDLCDPLVPSVGATATSLAPPAPVTTIGIHPIKDGSGQSGIFGFSGDSTPSTEGYFLRLTADKKIFRIAKVELTSGAAARSPGSTPDGTYFMPLGDVSPCGSFAGGQPMECKKILEG